MDVGEEVGLQSAQRLYPMDPCVYNDIRPDNNKRIVGVDREKRLTGRGWLAALSSLPGEEGNGLVDSGYTLQVLPIP